MVNSSSNKEARQYAGGRQTASPPRLRSSGGFRRQETLSTTKGTVMYLPWNASKARIREAENAQKNRLEIVKALSQGQISRRDLFKMGLITTGGLLVAKNGLSPFA